VVDQQQTCAQIQRAWGQGQAQGGRAGGRAAGYIKAETLASGPQSESVNQKTTMKYTAGVLSSVLLVLAPLS
jgi:hypothetical protein